MNRFKLAMIGSHGVGKTTLCYGVAARLKALDLGVEVVHEIARRCPLPINQETSVDAQAWILHTQIAEELVASHRYPVVVCDRSALDNFVYLLLAAGPHEPLEHLVEAWLPTYDLLVYVPIHDGLRSDGIRSPWVGAPGSSRKSRRSAAETWALTASRVLAASLGFGEDIATMSRRSATTAGSSSAGRFRASRPGRPSPNDDAIDHTPPTCRNWPPPRMAAFGRTRRHGPLAAKARVFLSFGVPVRSDRKAARWPPHRDGGEPFQPDRTPRAATSPRRA